MPQRKTRNHKVALGIIAGEGSPSCHQHKFPRLQVCMCDKTAVKKVAELWGTAIYTPPYSRGDCPPTPTNPEGRIYTTQVEGDKAIQTMQRPELEGTDIQRKALQKPCFK